MNTSFRLRPSFTTKDFPDLRLASRVFSIQEAFAKNLLSKKPSSAALQKGLSRFLKNPRIKPERLLKSSLSFGVSELLEEPVLLSCEDTILVRFKNKDAGPLMRKGDNGYVLHYSSITTPGGKFPHAWLSHMIFNRSEHKHKNQKHRKMPPEQRESRKWASVRNQTNLELRKLGFKGRIISINDREGDAWHSICSAVENKYELITRISQNRRLVDSNEKIKEYVHSKEKTAELELTCYKKVKRQAVGRQIRVQLRWAPVLLPPPRNDKFAKQTNLNLTIIELYEKRTPRKEKKFKSYILTNSEIKTTVEAIEIVKLYPTRWSVEVSNDILKNAIDIEDLPIRDKNEFKKAVAISGPVVIQIANWLALSRRPTPPDVKEIFDDETIRDIKDFASYSKIKIPPKLDLKAIIRLIGKFGGGDIREGREIGWRVAWRGWQRLTEFSEIKRFIISEHESEPDP